GESFASPDGRRHDCLGLIDAVTTAPPTSGPAARTIGELTADPVGETGLADRLTRFVNNGGRTTLGPTGRALGPVNRGRGSSNSTQHASQEGIVQGSVIGTYLHGPVLARNPQLADLLIARALGLAPAELAPLVMPEVDRLRRERLAD